MSSNKAVDLTLSGLLNVHKPQGMTSRQVVNQIQKLVRPLKTGHAGTLDPLATGVLMVCVGSATRLIRFVQDQPKEYLGEFILGKQSDTDDISGNLIETTDCPTITRQQLERCLPAFQGQIEQVPPQFSAVHINGQRAYDLARRGKSFDIKPRTVEVYQIALTAFEFPRFQLRIVCGSGTYIRSLGRDLGEQLKCGALMTSLVRTRIGDFKLESTMQLDDSVTLESIAAQLQPAERAVKHLQHYQCNHGELDDLCHGRVIECDPDRLPDAGDQDEIAVVTSAGTLVAIAEWKRDTNQLAPRQVYYQQSK